MVLGAYCCECSPDTYVVVHRQQHGVTPCSNIPVSMDGNVCSVPFYAHTVMEQTRNSCEYMRTSERCVGTVVYTLNCGT